MSNFMISRPCEWLNSINIYVCSLGPSHLPPLPSARGGSTPGPWTLLRCPCLRRGRLWRPRRRQRRSGGSWSRCGPGAGDVGRRTWRCRGTHRRGWGWKQCLEKQEKTGKTNWTSGSVSGVLGVTGWNQRLLGLDLEHVWRANSSWGLSAMLTVHLHPRDGHLAR